MCGDDEEPKIEVVDEDKEKEEFRNFVSSPRQERVSASSLSKTN